MDKYQLSPPEEMVLKSIGDVLRTLPTDSQYKVLRNLAHLMDREVTKPGAIRGAAAVAGSVARSQIATRPDRPKPKAKANRGAFQEGYSADYISSPAARELLAKREAIRASFSSPPTAAQKVALREVSKALREGWRVRCDRTSSGQNELGNQQ